MPHSVRVSDELYTRLENDGRIMRRSVASQLEYLARLGLAVENSQDIPARMLRELLQNAQNLTSDMPEPHADQFEAAFNALASMQDNPELARRLLQEDRPLTGREQDGKLHRRQPD